MRILIDLQGAQNDSKNRGIGRYSLSIAQAIARQRGEHEVLILLNAAFAGSIDEIREKFADLLPDNAFKIFNPLGPTHSSDSQNIWRRNASELLYEHAVVQRQPDILLICSPMDGWGDQTISSIHKVKRDTLVVPILHDLIPLIQHDHGDLDWPEPTLAWYLRKVDDLRRADWMLANSASSKSEAEHYLGFPAGQITNISAAAGGFYPVAFAAGEIESLKLRYSIRDRFILTASAIEHRKNPEHLIRAFALLPYSVRKTAQLVLIGKFTHPDYKTVLLALAKQSGLGENDLLFAGHVSDEDMVRLYAACDVFVFPSFHEGFGLPALEAMACGAPTIVSNATSLPEVVGWDAALFDPHDPQDIARSMARVLTDHTFRQQLVEHGLKQAKKFSWDQSARLAITALELAFAAHQAQVKIALPISTPARRRPRLAYFSPLSAAQSGIADYSAELLPELSKQYDIEVIVAQAEPVKDVWVLGNAPVRSVKWFKENAHSYDRILYQFGNAEYHAHMFDLLERYPGVVVLHDFYLSGVIGWVLANQQPGAWDRALLYSHGWPALVQRHQAKTQQDVVDMISRYPCNLQVLQQAQGVIVHSDYSLKLAAQWYGADMAADWAVIPHLRVPVVDVPRAAARADLGLADDAFLVCSFGLLGETKLNHRLIEAWMTSALMKDPRCRLVFVGKLPEGGSYSEQLRRLLQSAKGRITVTGWADSTTYKRYLAAADLAVQLRTQSRGETSGTVLDSMNYGLPTIVNANGSMADLPEEVVYRLADDFSTTQLREVLEQLYKQPAWRNALGQRAAAHIRSRHLPRTCAAQYAEAIERFHAQAEAGIQGLVGQATRLGPPDRPGDLAGLAEIAAQIYPPRQPATRQLLVDVSELAQSDAKTGIQRVVRSVLRELLNNPPPGYRVEPIYATVAHGYRYARHFTARFLGFGELPLDDDPIFATSGDIFWAPDWVPDVVRIHERELALLRGHGVKIIFTVHDILPLTLPETTHISVHEAHMRWLLTLARVSSGLICVSATVMANVKKWLALFGPQTGHTILLGWAHHGSDIIGPEEAQPVNPSPELSAQLAAMQRFPAFLMVGTVEPRKGHAQTLAAFEWLWNQGEKLNLVIVGKKGWKVDELAEHLVTHTERDRHLFWLQDIDDALLEEVYATSACLLAASLDEGFGLPLIEAARHKLPILARDIPVFHEVAGEHASYFSGLAPQDLADAVLSWLAQDHAGTMPKSDAIPWLTWAESTRQMLDVILDDQWQDQWTPVQNASLVTRHWASAYPVQSVVGQRLGTALWSTGHPGHLAYGPADLTLNAGSYTATWSGSVGLGGCDDGAHADICIQQGKEILARADLDGKTQADGHFIVTLPFTLKEDRSDMEVRVWVGERSDVRLDLLEICKASPLASGRSAESLELATANAKTQPSPSALIRRYWATHPKMNTEVGHRVGRSVHATGKKGCLLFGPYVGLPKGRYTATVFGAASQPGGVDGCWMDVAWNQGREVTVRQPLYATRAESLCEIGHVAFDLSAYAPDLEIRVHVESGVSLRLDGIALEETT